MPVDEVRKSGRMAPVAKRPMTKVGPAVEKGETRGFIAISRTMHIHPTVSELLPTLLQELEPLE